MLLLLLAWLALLAGPLLSLWLSRARHGRHLLQGINLAAFLAVVLLVLWHLLPDFWQQGFYAGFALLAVGLFLPWLTEKALHQLAHSTHLLTLVLAVAGLVLHSFMDGVGLSGQMSASSHGLLPLAVILHRLPVGIAVWALVRSAFSLPLTLLVFAGLLLATGIGFGFSEQAAWMEHALAFRAFQALAAGTLLHVVFHQPFHGHEGHSHGGH